MAVWTYLGPASNVDAWNYRTIMAEPDGLEIMQATRPMFLREDHYERLTGTLLGRFLGYRRPDPTGHVEMGECVRVLDREVVGRDRVWLNVTQEECDPAFDAIQRAAAQYTAHPAR